MPKAIEFKWESLDDSTNRVKVFGGWIVSTRRDTDSFCSDGYRMGCTDAWFDILVPDPNHDWVIAKPEVKPNDDFLEVQYAINPAQ